ncbi:MAG: [FeFe] hydrogenase H-cluster radical SAM maturase HydE [Clostridia bacterium]|nr:[FeFe] hydrogenase H-cluster radical SAM maturase HydE [Lachnospiraceae bacterium]NCC01787.1 [FeFe] hydrogenase H-cluster radical SAM maturase HydE [Clostridia bacterium]NCD02999.1 [FeFe] hydrogenase H-cluster radical SAM maturase HydE [Clostridia bacterium]
MLLKNLISQLKFNHTLSQDEFVTLLDGLSKDKDASEFLKDEARRTAQRHFGQDIYIRGLIEFTNYCRNDCYYCGIRRSNDKASRYHLTKEDILECCRTGYQLGFRTFVLQGGEDLSYSDEDMCEIISSIRQGWPDCAITLSVGERERDTYQKWFDAGANRFLLRHETAERTHYDKLHPPGLTAEHRQNCLRVLKSIGYQTGTGFMVGSPFQTTENLASDLIFIHELQPEMVGIGPFIPHQDTPFKDYSAGSLELTLHLISILRLMLPNGLLPATTALGTIHPQGREMGILAGANVVMPNLSPVDVRKKYLLYDNKICTGEESAECRDCLNKRLESIGYRIVTARGDYAPKK